MRVHSTYATAIVLLIAPCFLSGQQLTKDTKIERLLDLTNASRVIDQVFTQMKSMNASQIPPGSTPEQKAKAQEVHGKIMDLVKSRIGWDKLRPHYLKMYSETFSEEEIDGLLTFYESPAGKAMIEKMPVVMSKTMAMVRELMGDLMPEIQRIAKEVAAR
jgi:uncharacterized protein